MLIKGFLGNFIVPKKISEVHLFRKGSPFPDFPSRRVATDMFWICPGADLGSKKNNPYFTACFPTEGDLGSHPVTKPFGKCHTILTEAVVSGVTFPVCESSGLGGYTQGVLHCESAPMSS